LPQDKAIQEFHEQLFQDVTQCFSQLLELA
ncbi:unnamed protein product, partial [marine sediment metagenome]